VPRITKVYTRTGDDGTTGLGGGQRVPKDSARIAAFGDVDELNSAIGAALATGVSERLAGCLTRIQNDLFHLGSDLCILEEDKARLPAPTIEQRHVAALEALMDELSLELSPLENFILPGGAPAAAQLHSARAVCRRAERAVIALSRIESVGGNVATYLNRLSDALFVMARYENHRRGLPDVFWQSRA
jgi:cob(I)alamin adenosyltransferase